MTTLSYDSSESAPGELNAEEQESLALGEQMEAEQNQMLAGKFKDTESLESAYLELQKKLGSSTETTEEPESPDEPVDAETSDFLETLWNESKDEFSQETLDALSNMNANQIADMYLDYRESVQNNSAPSEFSDEDINALQQSAGGEKEYTAMLEWAKTNLSEQEIEMYDAVMGRGDPQSAFFAIQALSYRYNDSVGSDGQMLTGKPATDTKDVFRSQAELVNAMSDPRYDSDPAYRSDILSKLDRSDLNF
tara:strand:+ start:21 stop:773 length:753 start_codon:yes stop_codon:yes gene_type:complete